MDKEKKSKWLKLKEEDPEKYEVLKEKKREYSRTPKAKELQREQYLKKRTLKPKKTDEEKKRIIKERNDRYRIKNREKILDDQRKRREERRLEPVKQRRLEPVKESRIEKPIKAKVNKFTKSDELLYELILSQGKGQRTKKLDEMLINIAENFVHRFYTDWRLFPDFINASVLRMCQVWMKFNRYKSSNPLNYFTEVSKRAICREYLIQMNEANYGDSQHKRTFQFVNYEKCMI